MDATSAGSSSVAASTGVFGVVRNFHSTLSAHFQHQKSATVSKEAYASPDKRRLDLPIRFAGALITQ
jgi:hypothetical protein